MFFDKVNCIFLKIQKSLCNKRGSASIEHMFILPIVVLILTFVLNLSVSFVEKGQQVLGQISESRKTLLQIVKDKSGSITIFLCLFMTGFIVLLTVLCDITGLLGGKTYFDDCSITIVASVSTAYDEQLKEKYKLMAINKQEIPSIEAKVKNYFVKTIHEEEGAMYPVRVLELCLQENKTLGDENELKEQVVKVAREMATELVFESFRERFQNVGDSFEGKDNVQKNLLQVGTSEQEKSIDEDVKNILPEIFGRNILGNDDRGEGASDSGLSIAQDIEQGLFDKGIEGIDWLANNAVLFNDNVAIGEYVLGVFSNRCSKENNGEGVPEAEYVISGKNDEIKSCKAVENKIFALMYALNAQFFLTNPQYIAKTEEAVAKYSVGNVYISAALKVIVPMAWISAESKLDVDKLINDEKVPINKTEGTWQTKTIEQAGLLTIINGVAGSDKDKGESSETVGKALKSKSVTGEKEDDNAETLATELRYKDCLRIFLLLESSDNKIARIKDVVEKGIGTSIDDFISEIKISTEGRCSCLFTSGSWLPDKYREGRNGQTVKMSNIQVLNLGG